ncbi:survival factor 1 like protein [Zymoseptoria brevis]|uniref:Survival factor 1 like protein n=1 Tax=Zymoseptoria brevis TaxID=1047168 RepID=A0A0F4GV81_9PEZI|nr:survival factor 1 like protein [Zymoseptoria brevis]
MFNWVKQSVGLTDHHYGPEGLQSVALQTKDVQYTELKKEDLIWERVGGTNVETKTFYMTSDSGLLGMAQVIYSDVMGVRSTAQFSSKIFYPKESGKTNVWSSDNLSNYKFSKDNLDFKADGCSMELSPDGNTYHIKSSTGKKAIVDLKFTKTAPGFAVGKNGVSTFGTDPKAPWGKMKHGFWPTCKVEGSIVIKEGPVDFKGRGMAVFALQGMKPHFAAAKWNFCNFQSPTYSAVLMDFTTPPSYGPSTVAVGGIAVEGEILFAGASPDVKVEHTEIKGDPENGWPEPSAVIYSWKGKTKDGKDASAEIRTALEPRTDRLDVMGEVPKFVKQIVVGVAGTKPYIYQYDQKMTIKIKIGDEEKTEEGRTFAEATFIT